VQEIDDRKAHHVLLLFLYALSSLGAQSPTQTSHFHCFITMKSCESVSIGEKTP